MFYGFVGPGSHRVSTLDFSPSALRGEAGISIYTGTYDPAKVNTRRRGVLWLSETPRINPKDDGARISAANRERCEI